MLKDRFLNYSKQLTFAFGAHLLTFFLVVAIGTIIAATAVTYCRITKVQSELTRLLSENAETSKIIRTIAANFREMNQIIYLDCVGIRSKSPSDIANVERLSASISTDFRKLTRLSKLPDEVAVNKRWYANFENYNRRVRLLTDLHLNQPDALMRWSREIWKIREDIFADLNAFDQLQAQQSSEQENTHLSTVETSQKIGIALASISCLFLLAAGLLAHRSVRRSMMERHKALLAQVKFESAIETANDKADFLASMSHEIRTPLNAVIGITDVMLEHSNENELGINLHSLRASADHLYHLVDNVLAYSKLEASSVTLNLSSICLREVIERQLNVLASSSIKSKVTLQTEFGENLPLRILGDEIKISQVVLNLLSNAIKFSEGGIVKVSLTCDRQTDDSILLHLAVADTGIGIPESEIQQLFNPFSQIESKTGAKLNGAGLGLAISKKLITLMGGQIGVLSESGKGSTFTIDLPAKISGALDEDGILDSSVDCLIDKFPAKELGKLRILVAEDNSTNRIVIASILRTLEVDFTIVDDGSKVLPEMQSSHFDLILMDCLMPIADGFETTKQIRDFERASQTRQRIPIIALTASVHASDREKCMLSGMDGFASKPIRSHALAAVITETLARTG